MRIDDYQLSLVIRCAPEHGKRAWHTYVEEALSGRPHISDHDLIAAMRIASDKLRARPRRDGRMSS